MKQTIRGLALAILVFAAAASGPALASRDGAIRLTLDRANYTGDRGGEFMVVSWSGGGIVPAQGPGVQIPGGLFQTFCLETTQHLAIDAPLTWTLSSGVIGGGFAGGDPDPLDPRTAYLYTQFWNGSLPGYDYGQGPGRVASATSLQRAIYRIEGELVGAITVEYDGDPRAQAWVADADLATGPGGAWTGLGNVRTLNLGDTICTDVQSVLVMVNDVPCALGVHPPVTLYDAIAGSSSSRFAGETRHLAAGDVDHDGFPDLLNLTPTGAQIFHNDGTSGGAFGFTLVQEFAVDAGYRGDFLDLDGDCDLDIVIGDADYVLVAWNDGTGHFDVQVVYAHHFAVTTIAMPFDTFTDPRRPGNHRRFVLAGTEDMHAATAQGVPSLLPWAQVFDISSTGAVSLVQTLAPIAADDIVPADLDGDGDTDLVISNRSAFGADAIDIWESLEADAPGGGYVLAPPLDTSGLPWSFGYRVGVSEELSLAVGSWHRLDLWQRDPSFVAPLGRPLLDPAHAWLPPTDVVADPFGLHGWPSHEILATGFGDLTCDFRDELVFQGRHTPLVLVSLGGDPNLPSNRFVAAPAPGSPRDLLVRDWDRDANGAIDVIVGGTAGLFFYGNVSGGAAAPATPGVPAPPSIPGGCSSGVVEAMMTLESLVDPGHAPPLTHPAARTAVAEALAKLHAIDPLYLTSGAFAQPSPPLTQIQGIFAKLQAAHGLLGVAILSPGLEPAFVAELQTTASRLVSASGCLASQAIALGGTVKRASPERRAARLVAQARADVLAGSRLEAASLASERARKSVRLGGQAIRRYGHAFRHAAESWRLLRAAGEWRRDEGTCCQGRPGGEACGP